MGASASDNNAWSANRNFWLFGLFFFFYFFIMASYYPFFPIWLHDINNLSKTETGIVFGSISFFALCFQPIMGPLSDKLGLRKHLMWVIVGLLILFAPFFIYVFSPLLQYNIVIGALVGGLYLGFVFTGGSHAIEAYIEKVSRHSSFEYGRTRMFGCIGWAVCASLVGMLYTINNQFIFWLASGCALVLAVLLFLAKPDVSSTAFVVDKLGANKAPFSLRTALELLKKPQLWFFVLYIIGVPCVYDVFDQQFANFFTSFFETKQRGTEIFGFVTTGGELLNAAVMFFAPVIIARIGSKNALLLAGAIMSIRIIGSAFASSALEVVLLKILHMFEVPFLLVGSFKYITQVFEVRFSATVYLIGFCFSKQISMIFMSYFSGRLYDAFGFQQTYLFLGLIVLTFTVISAFTLTGQGVLENMRERWQKKRDQLV
ncbi:MFS transporter [Affinibrenneria salicis]|uniref:MFS transporter n=1 Tax=Affinibrenneria salicis TaxID=2590031 RepID=A0A5J5FXS9_9GAMM|nr:MFS transporter [Affinibrenneria salicis]KAA8998905.1 MFS transporter [Affinibrenneria salicis]